MKVHNHSRNKEIIFFKLLKIFRMHYSIVVHVCAINFFNVFIVPRLFSDIWVSLEKYTFFPGGGSLWVSRIRVMTDFQIFFCGEFN
jgi:hypothetical protein